jgi:hypothetical protein
MGTISDQHLREYFRKIQDIPGPVAEIGVDRGHTFKRIYRWAIKQNKVPCAFDSFCGMDTPGEFDDAAYPKGKFSQGGIENFKSWIPYSADTYKCYEGYIPICFEKYEADLNEDFSFILLDVDHYQPTVVGLEWSWPRLKKNGILVLDDFFETGTTIHATRAIHEWLEKTDVSSYKILNITPQPNGQIHIEKMVD